MLLYYYIAILLYYYLTIVPSYYNDYLTISLNYHVTTIKPQAYIKDPEALLACRGSVHHPSTEAPPRHGGRGPSNRVTLRVQRPK